MAFRLTPHKQANIIFFGHGRLGKYLRDGLTKLNSENIIVSDSIYTSQNFDKITSKNTAFIESTLAIIVSTPEGAKQNIEFCDNRGIDFICGTTGLSEEVIYNVENTKGNFRFFATNFSPTLFELFYIFENNFTNLNDVYLTASESHQAGKKDPSGTAMSVKKILQRNGINCEEYDRNVYSPDKDSESGFLKCFRNQVTQHNNVNGLPLEYFEHHAFHEYTLKSNNENKLLGLKNHLDNWEKKDSSKEQITKSVDFQLRQIGEMDSAATLRISHLVLGAETYLRGVENALSFYLENGKFEKRNYSMKDVLFPS